MFGEETSNTYPSQKIPSLNSVSKLFRKLNTAEALFTVTLIRSSTLSLIPSWSGTKASLGAVSGEIVDVTHMVPSPGSGLVATHPGGNAGAVTPSKFSTHGPDGLGATVAVAVGVGGGVPPAVAVAVAVGPTLGVGVTIGAPPPRSYASTKPFPVPPFSPASNAVYFTGGHAET